MSVVRYGDHEKLADLGFKEMPTHEIAYLKLHKHYTVIIKLKGDYWTLNILEAVEHKFVDVLNNNYKNLDDLIEVLNRKRIIKYWRKEDE